MAQQFKHPLNLSVSESAIVAFGSFLQNFNKLSNLFEEYCYILLNYTLKSQHTYLLHYLFAYHLFHFAISKW